MRLRVATQATGGHGESVLLPADPSAARDARRFLLGLYERWRLPDEATDVAVLLVSELTGNAVRHATGEIRVTARRMSAHRVRVEVHDRDPRAPAPRAQKPEAESGRGLFLLDSLAACWGVTPNYGDGEGKAVWFELA